MAARGDHAAVVGVLADAFTAEPVVSWLLGPDRCTDRRRRAFFRALVHRSVLAAGTCDLAEGGAAVWYAPGAYRPDSPVRTLLALPALATAFGPRLTAVAQADAEMRALHPTEPHWYLQFLGVRQDLAGQGLGSALLASRLERVDQTGAPAYLETATPRNLPLYQRYGFTMAREIRLAPDAPPEWLMWRPGRSGSRSAE